MNWRPNRGFKNEVWPGRICPGLQLGKLSLFIKKILSAPDEELFLWHETPANLSRQFWQTLTELMEKCSVSIAHLDGNWHSSFIIDNRHIIRIFKIGKKYFSVKYARISLNWHWCIVEKLTLFILIMKRKWEFKNTADFLSLRQLNAWSDYSRGS